MFAMFTTLKFKNGGEIMENENIKNYKDYFINDYCYEVKNKIKTLKRLKTGKWTKDESEFLSVDNWLTKECLTKKQHELFKNKDFKQLKKLVDKQLEKEQKKLELLKAEALEKYNKIKDLQDIKNAVFNVEWSDRRLSLGAFQTRATATVFYKNGTCKDFETSWTGGCGYDKPSTSLSEVCNALLKVIFIKHGTKILKDKEKHYKFYAGEPLYFQYGVGVSSYETFFKNLGYKVTYIPRGRNGENFTMIIENKRRRK